MPQTRARIILIDYDELIEDALLPPPSLLLRPLRLYPRPDCSHLFFMFLPLLPWLLASLSLIQVFPDEFHLATLDTYLSTCTQLQEAAHGSAGAPLAGAEESDEGHVASSPSFPFLADRDA